LEGAGGDEGGGRDGFALSEWEGGREGRREGWFERMHTEVIIFIEISKVGLAEARLEGAGGDEGKGRGGFAL